MSQIKQAIPVVHLNRSEKMAYLKKYFTKIPENLRDPAAIAYMASLDAISSSSPTIAEAIVQELKDQRKSLKLIASENFCSLPVQLAMGNLLTDKYSEGYVGHRFYAGCENVDTIEGEATEWAKKIFGADHAYVQPHSGADANLVAFWAILVQKIQSKEVEALGKKSIDELSPEEYEQVRKLLVSQKIMGMDLGSGGHLTHGYRHNVSAKMFRACSYGVSEKTGLVDYKELSESVKREKPLILIAGYSAYPRLLDFAKMREIADSVGAVFMVDMAHFAGLVAGKAMKGNYDPVPFAHIVTSTTHKTLRGPRGGLLLCKEEYRDVVNKGCPIVLGGPLPQVMAAKALAFKEASTPEFSKYAHQIIENAQSLAHSLVELGVEVITRGTDNHLIVIDVEKTFQLTGRQAETALREAHLTVNRNMIPRDVNGPWYTSGVRLGTAAITTLGMKPQQMKEIASIFYDVLKETKPAIDPKTGRPSRAKTHVPPQVLVRAQSRVSDVLREFPLYPELVID